MENDSDGPFSYLTEEQNELIAEIKEEILWNYGIRITTSQVVKDAVKSYLDLHFQPK